jgi:hypothetical protein
VGVRGGTATKNEKLKTQNAKRQVGDNPIRISFYILHF